MVINMDSSDLKIIKVLLDVIDRPRKARHCPERKQALKDLLLLHNKYFNTSYFENNSTCPSCVRTVLFNFRKLINNE